MEGRADILIALTNLIWQASPMKVPILHDLDGCVSATPQKRFLIEKFVNISRAEA